MRNVVILFCVIMAFVSLSCKENRIVMTQEEISLINDGADTMRMRVLSIENEKDSLFLRLQAKDLDVEKISTDEALQKLIKRMVVTLDDEGGVGLAAPQVGISRNLFLFMRISDPGAPYQVAINPKIIAHPEERICFEDDGCLSIPNRSGNSLRYAYVDVEYYNEKGERIQERLSGHSRDTDFTGIIFQHEFDHLEGVLYIDKLAD